MKETGCSAVKLEGGRELAEPSSSSPRGIPVMGHVGLMPQSVNTLGGYRARGKDEAEAADVMADAIAIAEAGAFSVVVEGVLEQVAQAITERIAVPTIGIGASADCDGQVLVAEDIIGLFGDFKPRFVKRYAELADEIGTAAAHYAADVRARRFPGPDNLLRQRKHSSDGSSSDRPCRISSETLRVPRRGDRGRQPLSRKLRADKLERRRAPIQPWGIRDCDELSSLKYDRRPHRRRSARAVAAGARTAAIGLVPTMGALHDGHLTLAAQSRGANKRTIATIFVNPSSSARPRISPPIRATRRRMSRCCRTQVDLLFAPRRLRCIRRASPPASRSAASPSISAARPPAFHRRRDGGQQAAAAGDARPRLFRREGFPAVAGGAPHGARSRHPGQIVGVPTIREADGLAMSSRNRYLIAEERAHAAALPRMLATSPAAARNPAPSPANSPGPPPARRRRLRRRSTISRSATRRPCSRSPLARARACSPRHSWDGRG